MIPGWRIYQSLTNSSRNHSRLLSSLASSHLVLTERKNKVTRVTMNNPKKLNGWTLNMLTTLFRTLDDLAEDVETEVVVLTGVDPYYCAGASLSEHFKLMHPRKFHAFIAENNEILFGKFLNFPKPILIAANGPAVGGAVTSALLCDAIIASERATFHANFKQLAVSPEGCSTVHFQRILGQEAAEKMLKHGIIINAHEALEIGFIQELTPHSKLLRRSQELAEDWVRKGKKRIIPGNQNIEEYRIINREESLLVADGFLSHDFLNNQEQFLRSRGKSSQARIFWFMKSTRPLWSKMLKKNQ